MRDGKISTEEYQKLKDMDIREIDPASAADIRGITVNPDLPARRAPVGCGAADEWESLRLPLRRSFG